MSTLSHAAVSTGAAVDIKTDSDINIAEIKTMVLNRMWASLDEKEQDEAFTAFWKCDESTTKTTRAKLLKHMATALRFRTVFIERASVEKKVGFLKKVVLKKPFCLYFEAFIRAWLVQNRRPLLKAFLDGASIPNEEGFATEDEKPTAEQFDAGIAAMTEKFNDRDIKLYLAYLAFFGGSSGFWNNILYAPVCKKLIEQLLAGQSVETPESTEDEEEDMEPEDNAQGFTTLDNHLIKTLVASAFHEEGALEEDAVEDLVDEIVEMNASRHRSLFHRGYFHALFERPFSFHFPGENSERRQWYLCGIQFGLLRRNEMDRCIDIFAVSEKGLGLELAQSSNSLCGPKLLPLLYLPLLRAGHLKLVHEFVRGQFDRLPTTHQRVSLVQGLLAHASKLLREGKTAEAEPLVDLLQELLTDEDCDLPQDFRSAVDSQIKRRKAQCLQAKGSFPAAREILLQMDKGGSNAIPSNALADLGLIEGGFRSLAAVLPKPTVDQNKALVGGLKRGVGSFKKAVDCGVEKATNGNFCLGVLHTLENPTKFAQERADHFQTAMRGMLEDPDAYATNGILDWTRFLLALALLETAEYSNYLPASDLMPGTIDTELRFPSFLWERMFEAAALFDDSSLAILIAEYLLSYREEATECLLANAALLARSESLFETVLGRFLSRKMPVRKCWAHLVQLLPAALRHQALKVAGTILDKLEAMAFSNKEFRGPFIEILKDSDRYSPAWDAEDARESLVNFLEMEGQKHEAAQVLREWFFHVRANGSPHQTLAVRQVLERLQALHVDPSLVEDLAELIQDSENANISVPLADEITGHVLYIGGNETQASYRKKIETELKAEHPDLTVTFYFPGWDSNWNVHLEKLKPMIDQSDVIVINVLIRTQLGRHLRSYCNADHPWLSCTGRGFESLKRSILHAAAWAAHH